MVERRHDAGRAVLKRLPRGTEAEAMNREQGQGQGTGDRGQGAPEPNARWRLACCRLGCFVGSTAAYIFPCMCFVWACVGAKSLGGGGGGEEEEEEKKTKRSRSNAAAAAATQRAIRRLLARSKGFSPEATTELGGRTAGKPLDADDDDRRRCHKWCKRGRRPVFPRR